MGPLNQGFTVTVKRQVQPQQLFFSSSSSSRLNKNSSKLVIHSTFYRRRFWSRHVDLTPRGDAAYSTQDWLRDCSTPFGSTPKVSSTPSGNKSFSNFSCFRNKCSANCVGSVTGSWKKKKKREKKKNPLELVIAKSWGDSLQTNFSDMEIPRYPFISFSFSLFYHKG